MTKGSEGPSSWPAGSVASQLTGSGSILRRRKIPWVADSGGPAPLAPRSGPRAATLFGGLRPGSLRVHDPCKDREHGSRPGFPGRRQPRGPAASGNVARGLQVLLPGEAGLLPSPVQVWRHPLTSPRGPRPVRAPDSFGDASQMSPASEGTPSEPLATSDIGLWTSVLTADS